ncbi:MAG: hypothetical protein AABN33_08180 [Acidobacteriota bacterium]
MQPDVPEGGIGPLINSRVALQDCLFLTLVVLLSLVLYIKDLGLYSDDWHFLGLLSNSSDQSLFGLIGSVFPDTRLRPIESLYVAGLYWLFGFHTFEYHIVNAVVFTVTIILFYLSLNELIHMRLFTVAIPLVYALLPHYSSNRFWFIAFVINLSIGLYFLSLYSDLRAVRARHAHIWRWKLAGFFALLCSALGYEVALPLFLLNPVLVWWRAKQLYDPSSNKELIRKTVLVSLASNTLGVAVIVIYKILTARGEPDLFVHRMGIFGDYSSHLVKLAVGAIGVNYGSYGIGLPVKIARVLSFYPNPKVLAVGVLLGLAVFGYLYRITNRQATDLPSEASYFRLMAFGLIVFVLGYSIFLTNSQVGFSSTGVYNRSAIAAALGVAISFVGVIGWVSWVLPSLRLRRSFFCLLIALVCMSGFLLNNTIAAFWISASRQQKEVIAAVRQQFPTLRSETTLFLDGVCPYTGPGIVFECYWDVSGMLKVYYADPSLKGDIVKHNLKIEEQGLSTSIYGERRVYPYGDKLFLFHLGQNKLYQLSDADTARRYFQDVNPDYKSNCSEADEGYGASIF